MNFTVLEPPTKIFPKQFGLAVPTCTYDTHVGFSIPQKFFCKMVTSYRSLKVSSFKIFSL